VTYTNRYVVHLCWFLRPGLSFYRLAFTKAERLPPYKNEERWILSPDPKLVREVNVSIDPGDGISLYASSIPQARQETMLVQDPNDTEVFTFVVCIN